ADRRRSAQPIVKIYYLGILLMLSIAYDRPLGSPSVLCPAPDRNAMPTNSRVSLLALAVPTCFLLGGYTDAAAQGALWSDPATWRNGRVPSEGEAVVIDRDREVVLDVSPPPLRSLTINGKLSFANDSD